MNCGELIAAHSGGNAESDAVKENDISADLAATGAVDRVFGVRLCRAPDGVWYVKAEG